MEPGKVIKRAAEQRYTRYDAACNNLAHKRNKPLHRDKFSGSQEGAQEQNILACKEEHLPMEVAVLAEEVEAA